MLKKLYNYAKSIIITAGNDSITVYSAYASFYIVISFVPFLILILMLTGRFITFTAEDIVHIVEGNMPKSVISFLSYTINEVLVADSVSIISVPAVMLVWTASRSVVALEKGLDCVYKVKEKRGFIKLNLQGVLHTLIFVGAILVSLGLVVFGNVAGEVISNIFPPARTVIDAVVSARVVISMIILIGAFTCVFTFATGRKLKFLKQLPGAVFSATGWMIFSYMFSIYIDNFSNKSYLYGSLTAMVIMMFWIYFCMIFIFLGGELNYFLMDGDEKALR